MYKDYNIWLDAILIRLMKNIIKLLRTGSIIFNIK